jgi:DNA polymerase type B, organellar and viral
MINMRYLRHNINTTTPSSHLVVAVALEPPSTTKEGVYSARRLAAWSATSFRYYKGEVTRRVEQTQDNPFRFWAHVSARLDRARPLWIWTYQAGVAVTALALWDEMDRGSILIDEPDWRYARRAARSPKAKQRRGFIADSDPPSILKLWSSGGQQLQIVDIRNWYRCHLRELPGAESGYLSLLVHGSEPMDSPKLSSQEDRVILEHTVIGLLNTIHTHDMGVMQATGPAQAMQCFRHKFMDQQILIHDNKEARKLERACYYGGRVEPFFIGTIYRDDDIGVPQSIPGTDHAVLRAPGPIYNLDVSGLYPSIMRLKDLPCRLASAPAGPIDESAVTPDALRTWCAEVTVASEIQTYPYRTDTQTLWCTGRFRTFLCGPELADAWMNGHIAKVHLACPYNTNVLFTRYVDYWWAVRQRAKEVGDLHGARLAKLMLNSLYGKFGQKMRRWDTVLGEKPRERWGSYALVNADTKQIRILRGLAGVLQERTECEDYRQSFPAISAFVTAHGRCLMDSLRYVAQPHNVYYQCTDGLYVSREGYERLNYAELVQPDKLGSLRLVGTADYMHIYGCNDYVFGDVVVRSGISWESSAACPDSVDQERTLGLHSYLDHGPGSQVMSKTIKVDRTEVEPRGFVGEDGWVVPFKRIEV